MTTIIHNAGVQATTLKNVVTLLLRLELKASNQNQRKDYK